MFQTRLLSKSQIQSLITMGEVLDAVEQTFKGMADGTVINPTKVTLDLGETASYPPYGGHVNAMPAYIGWLDTAGIKWAGGFFERKKHGLGYISSLILLIDPKMGNFKAVMDGAHITNLRTGAQSAIALKYLHPDKNIRIGLYGAGMQGHTQAMAISQIFNIEKLCVYDISPDAARKYAEDMKNVVQGEIVIAKNPKEPADADAIICVTQSNDKFLKNEWIKPGTIVFPMGSYQECDDDFILSADKIIVDHVGQCLHRGALKELCEEGKISERNIFATIGEVVAGKKEIKHNKNERILCIPIGTGAMDIAVASIVFQKAESKGIGGIYEFE